MQFNVWAKDPSHRKTNTIILYFYLSVPFIQRFHKSPHVTLTTTLWGRDDWSTIQMWALVSMRKILVMFLADQHLWNNLKGVGWFVACRGAEGRLVSMELRKPSSSGPFGARVTSAPPMRTPCKTGVHIGVRWGRTLYTGTDVICLYWSGWQLGCPAAMVGATLGGGASLIVRLNPQRRAALLLAAAVNQEDFLAAVQTTAPVALQARTGSSQYSSHFCCCS